MRTKTPILKFTLNPTLVLEHNAKLTDFGALIKEINGKVLPREREIKVPLDQNMKLLLDDFITLSKLPKSIFISYSYIISGENIYICYDAISVKDGQDNKETLTPALFIKTTGQFVFIAGLSDDYLSVEERNQLLQSGHVHLNIDFERVDLKYNKNSKQGYEFTIHQKFEIFRYPWGEAIKLLPMPKLPDPGKAPKHGQLFGIDDDSCGEIWESIEKLNTILRTPGNKKVFIKGEPGSGKEVFAHAIHYGSVLLKPKNLVVRAVAGADTQELRELLFGREVNGVSLPGLIKKADGGTLFLDEFDKINKDFYPVLLRVLEAEEYVPVDGKEILKVGDVNWIFAGAFMDTGVSNAKSDLPQDFWSRLTSYIQIENPIKFQPQQDQPKAAGYIISEDFFCTPRKPMLSKYSYAQVVFLYFFLREAVKKGKDVDYITTNNDGDFRSNIVRKLFIEEQNNGLLKPHKKLYDFARKFNEKIYEGKYTNTQFSFSNHKTEGLVLTSANFLIERKHIIVIPKQVGIPFGCLMDSRLRGNDNMADVITGPKKDLLDSVRSIRQAAKIAFSKCYYSALTAKHPEKFWDNQGGDQKTALDEAVESVKIARKN